MKTIDFVGRAGVGRRLMMGAIALTTATGMTTGVASAANVVPGADGAAKVVVTGSHEMTVTIPAADAGAIAITGTVKNNSDVAFTCAGVSGKSAYGGDVAPANLVAKAEQYYRTNLYRELPSVPVKSPRLPLIGPITLGEIDLGSAESIFQGLGGLAGKANKTRGEIADAYSKARVAGHAGQVEKFEVKAGESHEFTAQLPAPTSGARTDFDAAAFFMCTKQGAQQPYVFTGFEAGTTPPAAPLAGSDALGSSSLGSS